MDRLDFDRRQLALLAGILIAAVLATLFFTRKPAQPQTAPLVPVSAPTSPTASASPSPSGEVVVEVAGKVRRPMVVTLPKGARVMDALDAAGGAKPGVDTTDQNLARVLVDGEQIRIGLAPATAQPVTGSSTGTTSLININTADLTVLQEIPGVGPVLAQRIITYREQNGGFTSVEQLTEVSGIGEATFAQMQPLITVGG